jgi:hypothetical protein
MFVQRSVRELGEKAQRRNGGGAELECVFPSGQPLSGKYLNRRLPICCLTARSLTA